MAWALRRKPITASPCSNIVNAEMYVGPNFLTQPDPNHYPTDTTQPDPRISGWTRPMDQTEGGSVAVH